MNNSNGAAMLARIKPGDLVTIRDDAGNRLTGRAERPDGLTRPWMLRIRRMGLVLVTTDNVLNVQPDTRTQTSAESDAVPTARETFGK